MKLTVAQGSSFFFLKKREIPNLGKHACQNIVAMVTASSMNNDM